MDGGRSTVVDGLSGQTLDATVDTRQMMVDDRQMDWAIVHQQNKVISYILIAGNPHLIKQTSTAAWVDGVPTVHLNHRVVIVTILFTVIKANCILKPSSLIRSS